MIEIGSIAPLLVQRLLLLTEIPIVSEGRTVRSLRRVAWKGCVDAFLLDLGFVFLQLPNGFFGRQGNFCSRSA